jgi:hypothetical protein
MKNGIWFDLSIQESGPFCVFWDVQVCISASDIIWIGTKVEEHIKFN